MNLKRTLNLLLLFSFGLGILSCHQESEPNLTENHGPLTLEQVYSSKLPFELYSQAYPAFTFESTAQIANADDSAPKAKTVLKKNEAGDYQLIRAPLYQAPDVEIRVISGKAYVRATGKPSFFRTRNQSEFDRLKNVALLEILTSFQTVHFEGTGTLKDSLLCSSQEAGELCTDPNTGLPIKGLLSTKTADGMPMRVSFRLEPQPMKTVTIPTP
jgi:hypothetical protein